MKTFNFKYISRYKSYNMTFLAFPNSFPPTNIHAIVDRNETENLLRSLANAVLYPKITSQQVINLSDPKKKLFNKVIYINYDGFEESPPPISSLPKIPFKTMGIYEESIYKPSSNFLEALQECNQEPKKKLWEEVLQLLCLDPTFAYNNLNLDLFKDSNKKSMQELLDQLNLGHKFVLQTMARLVSGMEENSLLLLKNPEIHLPPQLLSVYLRALRALLTNKNSVAILTTDSPIVLQEIPSTCINIKSQRGSHTKVYRPIEETFGETIGQILSFVFQYNITNTGFYTSIEKQVKSIASVKEAPDKFSDQLGRLGLSLLWSMLSSKDIEE